MIRWIVIPEPAKLAATRIFICIPFQLLDAFGKAIMEETELPAPPPPKHENFFLQLVVRLFWPGNRPEEAYLLGIQGYLLCIVIALVSAATLGFDKQYTAALLTFLFYFLGGIGVREHERLAALLITAGYLLNLIANWISGAPPGAFTILGAILLLANIRATLIAHRWARRRHHEVSLERLSDSWSERLLDELPAYFWPRVRVLFILIAAIYLLLVLIGIGTMLWGRIHTGHGH